MLPWEELSQLDATLHSVCASRSGQPRPDHWVTFSAPGAEADNAPLSGDRRRKRAKGAGQHLDDQIGTAHGRSKEVWPAVMSDAVPVHGYAKGRVNSSLSVGQRTSHSFGILILTVGARLVTEISSSRPFNLAATLLRPQL